MAAPLPKEKEFIHLLSCLTLAPEKAQDAMRQVCHLADHEREQLLALADSHHVVIRALTAIETGARQMHDEGLRQWAATALARERMRITNALRHLERVTTTLEAAGCPTVVMKSLDHVPDLGNDLDLYTTASPRKVVPVFMQTLSAKREPRSWGDRLAQKWNFALHGLPESVEIHVERLGQMGEHTWMARRFVTRRVEMELEGHRFFVPAPEERIVVATLQRMYRHFYFRVCDIANSARIVESGTLDYVELRKSTERAGIWPGVASYLKIVSDYVERYRGEGLNLPQHVLAAAVLGGADVHPRARFLRVPIMPYGANLFAREITTAALNGDVPATFRLSLMPYLATAAAVSYKLTGSDKGIW